MKNTLALCIIASSAVGALTLACCSSSNTADVNMANAPTPDMATAPPDAAVASYAIGGSVNGVMGTGLVLQLNGASDLAVESSSVFTFAKKLTIGASYAVTVKTQPTAPAQTCTVNNGTGVVGIANIPQVDIVCVTNPYKIGGSVSGLTGSVVLQNNGGDDLTLSTNGAFSFAQSLVAGTNYNVTVKTQPAGLLCTITSGYGVVNSAATTGVMVACGLPPTCKSIKAANPAATDGSYMIDPDGAGPFAAINVFCDMTTDGGGYTEYAVTGGISTFSYDVPNSCDAVGLKLAVSRSKAHITAMLTKYGASFFQTVPGVYGKAAGNYTGCIMNSGDNTCGGNWVALDQGTWWARDTVYSEPNGDYTPGCWLLLQGQNGNGDLVFNDANCIYATGGSYVCSDNAK